ncbi:ectoine/hydroxyectoine ABC transporter permease subunit EhuD [Streptosporangium sp. NBC_01639]|uniref:ectoine/hydroxyectoine ABC transporter permease subunit EhuD n=1 Tax=unclassified Streptosporangium TaxID=2632669 RepID=UPI002DD8002B|nr:ectoine/hydroxyectoine ABC transporter permease subunit EhuD [Streptosporangium sp. NBC_01756]WSC87725.1 ectoine/hydroxyectoine ABC transporter permease subunit EhuD [Streptosporangium sp. NBC_01756]WTD53598.1 ectoine/hydroxyectoine ABC transporter permease subunit EhuD [Streptosporangium sp. NBC_01639]
MNWDWDYALEIAPEMLSQGLIVTVQATLAGAVLAFVLGLLLAMLLRSGRRWVSLPTRLFVEFVRSTPLVAQLFFVFFVFPSALGITMSALTTGIIVLGVHYSCYTAEVYRAGIDGVPKGQWEAAVALNLPRFRVWTSVILPQAVRRALPVLGNYLIVIFKETPQLTLITVVDVLGTGRILASESYRYLEPITIAGLFFLIVAVPASIIVRRLERRLAQ